MQISGCLGTFADLPSGLLLVEAGLGIQLGTSHVYPGPAEAATNFEFPGSSKLVAQGWLQVLPVIDLHQNSQETPEPTNWR